MTVAELITELIKYPSSAEVYAYEGEITGVVIKTGKEQLGCIECSEFDTSNGR